MNGYFTKKHLVTLFLLFVGFKIAYCQNISSDEFKECVNIINNDKKFKGWKIHNKLSDTDIIYFGITKKENGYITISASKSKENEDVVFNYTIDIIKKEIKSVTIEDLRL